MSDEDEFQSIDPRAEASSRVETVNTIQQLFFNQNLSSGSLIRLLDFNMFSAVGDTTVTPGVHGLGCRKVIMSLWIFLRILPDKEGILDIFSVICSLLT